MAESPVELGSAILRHGIVYFGGAVSRCCPAQVGTVPLGSRGLSLRRRYPIVVLAVGLPRLASVGWSEAIRHRGHEVVFARIDFVLIVKDIRLGRPSRWLAVVAVASVHGAKRSSLRATEALRPAVKSLPNSASIVCRCNRAGAGALRSDGWCVGSERGAWSVW